MNGAFSFCAPILVGQFEFFIVHVVSGVLFLDYIAV